MVMTAFLNQFNRLPEGLSENLTDALSRIAFVAQELSYVISRGDLGAELQQKTSINSDGDDQKPLDVYADEAYLKAMSNSSIKLYASEEQEKVIDLGGNGSLALAIDPLDGSSNIDTNVSIGSIFSIRAIPDNTGIADNELTKIFLSPASNQLAAGYVIFGPQTVLVFTVGKGILVYTLDRAQKIFIQSKKGFRIPADTKEYAINASNARHWEKRMKNYIDDSIAGKSGPRGIDFNMRWVASLVAETHRILSRGGIFIYPSDSREGYSKGRLRMVYECAPIAFLIEQAEGAATDCCDRILDLSVDELHQRTPFAFGSKNEIARLQAYNDLPDAEVSPLFRKRGLFDS